MTDEPNESDARGTERKLVEQNGVLFEVVEGPVLRTVAGPLPSSIPDADLEHTEADHE